MNRPAQERERQVYELIRQVARPDYPGWIRTTDLARITRMSPSGIRGLVDRLVERGLVVRTGGKVQLPR